MMKKWKRTLKERVKDEEADSKEGMCDSKESIDTLDWNDIKGEAYKEGDADFEEGLMPT